MDTERKNHKDHRNVQTRTKTTEKTDHLDTLCPLSSNSKIFRKLGPKTEAIPIEMYGKKSLRQRRVMFMLMTSRFFFGHRSLRLGNEWYSVEITRDLIQFRS